MKIVPPDLQNHLDECEICRKSLGTLSSAIEGFAVLRNVRSPDPMTAVQARLAEPRQRVCFVPALAGGTMVCCLVIALFLMYAGRDAPVKLGASKPTAQPKVEQVPATHIPKRAATPVGPSTNRRLHEDVLRSTMQPTRDQREQPAGRCQRVPHQSISRKSVQKTETAPLPEVGETRIELVPIVIEVYQSAQPGVTDSQACYVMVSKQIRTIPPDGVDRAFSEPEIVRYENIY